MKYEIVIARWVDDITGSVGGDEVIVIRRRHGKWQISAMSNVPDWKNIEQAKKILKCQLMVIADMEELNASNK